ncbi:MAG TPA: MBL fold metallo-hydrolase [Treponemataceae bacterium]|nr:MBL fold metallo-hydrolase [Treponemataceae bacterium]
MEKIEVSTGVWLLNIPEHSLSILCGCPPDVVKLLLKRGLIHEKKWDKGLWETGPNAILLSDIAMQGGKFANLAEFPILQMFYRQGMIIPGHPGNTGRKPLLIGMPPQLTAVGEYLFRGTYGLENKDEIIACGILPEIADEIIRIKTAFAFGNIRKTEDILEMVSLTSGECEIRPGLLVKRLGINRYLFSSNGDSKEINLNLEEGETYVSPVLLEYHNIQREYFSVIHIGEGDGWNPNKPCMSSIIIFQGKIYLIDTGPNILDSLTALGISVNEIEGIFHTHAHDDHFAGLTSLVHTDHRIKYYSTALVRNSVMKKLSALMGVPENRFMRSFEIHDLKFNEWNNIAGLEVQPMFSPHPVETNVLFFRTLWDNDYKTYAHLADMASFDLLNKMLLKAENRTEVSEKLYHQFTTQINKPFDIKKIDVGGGMIHGEATDFISDSSKKVVLSHLSRELTHQEMEIGTNSTFGMEDCLIPSAENNIRRKAKEWLVSYFPDAAGNDIHMLLNCPIEALNTGFVIQKRDTTAEAVYLIITGVAEMIHTETEEVTMLSAGTLIGEASALEVIIPQWTYRARSIVNALKIPLKLYEAFIRRNAVFSDVARNCRRAFFLQTTPLFGEMVSSPVLHSIAPHLVIRSIEKGQRIDNTEDLALIVVKTGCFDVLIDSKIVDRIYRGGFFGEECVFFAGSSLMHAVALENTDFYLIQAHFLHNIPIIEWKMLQTYERRLSSYGNQNK